MFYGLNVDKFVVVAAAKDTRKAARKQILAAANAKGAALEQIVAEIDEGWVEDL